MIPTTDPTLESLVPRTTRARTAVGLVVALALLTGAWVSVDALRPGVVPGSGAGSWSPEVLPGRVVSTFTLAARGWTGAEVAGVRDVAGARATDVWVLRPPSSPGAPADLWAPDDAELARLVDDHALVPVRLAAGERALLVVAWEITDCDALHEGERPQLELGAPLGVHLVEELPEFTSPGFDVDTLRAAGLCA